MTQRATATAVKRSFPLSDDHKATIDLSVTFDVPLAFLADQFSSLVDGLDLALDGTGQARGDGETTSIETKRKLTLPKGHKAVVKLVIGLTDKDAVLSPTLTLELLEESAAGLVTACWREAQRVERSRQKEQERAHPLLFGSAGDADEEDAAGSGSGVDSVTFLGGGKTVVLDRPVC